MLSSTHIVTYMIHFNLFYRPLLLKQTVIEYVSANLYDSKNCSQPSLNQDL